MTNLEEFGRHWMLILWRTLEKDHSTKCTTTISTTLFCVCNRTITTTVTTLVFLYTWNGFQIVPSYDNNQIRQKIIGDLIKLQTTLFDVLAINNVSFTPLYKEVKTWKIVRLTQQFYKCQNSAEIVSHQSLLRNS